MRERDWAAIVARGVALAVVLGSLGTVALVVYAGGLAEVTDAIARLPARHAVAAVGLVGVASASDALRYRVMAAPLGVVQPLRRWLAVAFVNLFGAYAVNAGAPAAAYVLAERGVDGGRSFALALAKQILFVPAVLLPVCVAVVVDPTLAGGAASRAALWFAGVFGLATLASVVAVATWPAATSRLLARAHVPSAPRERFVHAIGTIFRAPGTLVAAVGLALVNQAAIAGIVVALAAGLGVDVDAGLCVRALVFSAVSESAPTPAGAGISELTGAWLFVPLAPAPVVVAVVVVWRFLALYVPIAIGGVLLARSARRRMR